MFTLAQVYHLYVLTCHRCSGCKERICAEDCRHTGVYLNCADTYLDTDVGSTNIGECSRLYTMAL